MPTLTRELRRSLENTVRAARRVAEEGAHKAIEQLAVHHHEPWPSMTPAQRELRNRLRAHGRQLGDRRDERRGTQGIDRLATECAYEHWHRMLFARFLAETELLIEPESGVAISLEECQELARAGGRDWFELAAEFAQRMLPQIFRNGDPVLEIALLPETRSALEDLMKALPDEMFLADDSLGWVYQYWQADRKEEINRSEKKIGAEELPAVTQLFTEDYMVFFLLHNTLGAWWAGRVLAANPGLAATAASEVELRSACALDGVEWTYLRFVREADQPWRPAAGTFEGWPKAAKDITLLDPCMGSGHFLVFALPMLAALRARDEGIAPERATLAVLRDNLFGLEIDPRCTQIAAFNLALAAWRRVGYRVVPALHLACSGLSLGMNKAEWLKLAETAAAALPIPPKADLLRIEDNLFSDAMKRGFERLYDLFARAPWLGSLIDPRASGGDLLEHGFADLEPILAQVMAKADTAELSEMAVAAQGLAKAAQILADRFTLVATNVPYLGMRKQGDVLKDFCAARYPDAKEDLATVFASRISNWCEGGTMALVAPQNWFYQYRYRHYRRCVLQEYSVALIGRLGEGGFQSADAAGAFAALTLTNVESPQLDSQIQFIDASNQLTVELKATHLALGHVRGVVQRSQLANPDSRLSLEQPSNHSLLSEFVTTAQGIKTGDDEFWVRCFWEVPNIGGGWRTYQTSSEQNIHFAGRSLVINWKTNGEGMVRPRLDSPVVGKMGVVASAMRQIAVTQYSGDLHYSLATPLVPINQEHLTAIWAFCGSPEYNKALREIEQNIAVTTDTLAKVPFDLAKWQKVAAERYPNGLPKAYSGDATQWLFDGLPKGADTPLHVAVGRLVGYRWPRQTGSGFPDCPALDVDAIEKHADHDGIVTLSPVKGEQSAAGRLTALLSDAFGSDWSAAMLNRMLVQVGHTEKSLDDWLRDRLFEQHCALFHQRPFVWHIWDGRLDGFNALVNYHRLAAPNGEGRRTLEKLLYTYLGDWIDRQRSDQKAAVEGADARVAAAEHLKTELTNILAGEPPYDLFVRWKPLAQQAIGWEPDINDGVRMNIRPFIAAKPLGARAKGACILRSTPKIKWEKDRGKEPQRPREDFPWFWGWDGGAQNFEGAKSFDGNRWNDLHYSRSFKEAVRARIKK
jgi:hypothetical protein